MAVTKLGLVIAALYVFELTKASPVPKGTISNEDDVIEHSSNLDFEDNSSLREVSVIKECENGEDAKRNCNKAAGHPRSFYDGHNIKEVYDFIDGDYDADYEHDTEKRTSLILPYPDFEDVKVHHKGSLSECKSCGDIGNQDGENAADLEKIENFNFDQFSKGDKRLLLDLSEDHLQHEKECTQLIEVIKITTTIVKEIARFHRHHKEKTDDFNLKCSVTDFDITSLNSDLDSLRSDSYEHKESEDQINSTIQTQDYDEEINEEHITSDSNEISPSVGKIIP